MKRINEQLAERIRQRDSSGFKDNQRQQSDAVERRNRKIHTQNLDILARVVNEQRFIDDNNDCEVLVNGTDSKHSESESGDEDSTSDGLEADESSVLLQSAPSTGAGTEHGMRGYLLPKNTVLHNYLKRTTNAVRDKKLDLCQMIISPPSDPLTKKCIGEPDPWYLCDTRIFLWLPFDQFGHLLQLSMLSCVNKMCDSKCFRTKGLYWRPMFHYDKIDWVLYQRVHCKKCNKTVGTIDERLLATLPTRIIERFPYIVPREGPGLHESMIYMFSNLVTKQIVFGP